MICSDDYPTLRRHILNAVVLDLPEHSTEKADDGPERFKRPLRKYTGSGGRSCAVLLNRICSVGTQSDQARVRCILQRPLLIDELDVNPRHPIGPDISLANGRMCCDAVLLTRQ